MVKKRADKIVEYLTKRLLESDINVYKVVLFGSQNNGNPNKDSDLDLAVISDDFKNKSIWDRGPMIMDLEREVMKKFDIPIDLIKLTVEEYENETRMIASYVKEGKVVYSK
ncbi:MAG: nucleotidyltransferase domain-containing protein [Ignavibacteriaceae bacterium]|nr:nucleotidyltransferase domain-containing protein [Ignavibacteriaceae bacterium]